MKSVPRVLFALLIAGALAASPAYAKGNKGGGKPEKAEASDHGKDKDKKKDKHSAHNKKDAAGPDKTPGGWDEGKKKGWDDCTVPPGLAKNRDGACKDGKWVNWSKEEKAKHAKKGQLEAKERPKKAGNSPKTGGGTKPR